MTATDNSYGTFSQKGAALIVSMVMLLVITAIGVAVMSGSHLELMMSNNSQLQSDSFRNAEISLAKGANNLPPNPTAPLTPDPSNIDNWANNALNITPTSVTSAAGSVIGSYVAEYLSHSTYSRTAPYNYVNSTNPCQSGDPDFCLDVYRIWAYGVDAKGAKTLLQKTIIKTKTQPTPILPANNFAEMP